MRAASVLVLLALAAGAGCGGDDESDAPAGGGQAAEAKVKDQLRAIADDRADAFCATLTAEYGRTFTRQIATATDSELADCPAAFQKARSLSSTPTFEGSPLARQDIDRLDLKSSVVLEGDRSTATVEGPRGQARYELVVRDGEWRINRAKAN